MISLLLRRLMRSNGVYELCVDSAFLVIPILLLHMVNSEVPFSSMRAAREIVELESSKL
jgi:hypothetical protein